MAPLRRYLRITKHSVLEVRIYLDRPSDAEAWLLRRENPALPRVIQAVRPLVLPKLREENERVGGKGSSKARKRGVKDVVVEDDFEVSIFLTDLSSRHSVLTKQKIFKDKPRIQSNSGNLTGWLKTGTSDQPVEIDDGTDPVILREDDDEVINLNDIPEADKPAKGDSKKRKKAAAPETLVESDSDESFQPDLAPTSKSKRSRGRRTVTEDDIAEEELDAADDKKKLVVKRKGPRKYHLRGRTSFEPADA